MEDFFEGFSESITKWDIIRDLVDLDIDDINTDEPKQSNPGVQLLPRQDVMLYGRMPKMEQKVYVKCKECRLVFNPRDVLAHTNYCSGKSSTAQQSLLKKKVKSKGSSSKKPHSSSLPPPPLFKEPPSPPISAPSNTPATTPTSSIVLPELKVSVTKVILPKIPKLTTVSSSTAPTCTTTSRTSETVKSSSSSNSKSHSSHSPSKSSSSHHNPKSSGHSHYPKSSHHHESSSSSSRHSHGSHGSHGHSSHHGHSSRSSAKSSTEAAAGHSPSSSKYRHKKSRKSTPASAASKATSTTPSTTSSTAGLNLEDYSPKVPCMADGSKAARPPSVVSSSTHRVPHFRKIVPRPTEAEARKDEKEIFCQNTSYVPIAPKIVSTIETTPPLITTYIMPKATTHSRQIPTSVLASKKSNVMESETPKNGFITQNLDSTQDHSCVNVPIVFMPMSPISIVNPTTQYPKLNSNVLRLDVPQASLLKPKPFFLPIPSNHSNIQIYKSHPKPVVMPTFGMGKIGGAIMMRNPHIERQRSEILELLNAKRKAVNNSRTLSHSPHRPNILKSKSINKRHASDRPAATESKQMRLISDVNGFILHADVSDAPETPRNHCIQEKIALLNMK